MTFTRDCLYVNFLKIGCRLFIKQSPFKSKLIWLYKHYGYLHNLPCRCTILAALSSQLWQLPFPDTALSLQGPIAITFTDTLFWLYYHSKYLQKLPFTDTLFWLYYHPKYLQKLPFTDTLAALSLYGPMAITFTDTLFWLYYHSKYLQKLPFTDTLFWLYYHVKYLW